MILNYHHLIPRQPTRQYNQKSTNILATSRKYFCTNLLKACFDIYFNIYRTSPGRDDGSVEGEKEIWDGMCLKNWW